MNWWNPSSGFQILPKMIRSDALSCKGKKKKLNKKMFLSSFVIAVNQTVSDFQVRQIKNEAKEISEKAESQADLLFIVSQANYTNTVELARSRGLQLLYSSLGITSQEHKNSFDYLRTLRGLDNVHLTVDFQQRIAGKL